MSAEFNTRKTTGVTGKHFASVIGRGEPIAHPLNCGNTTCPYGHDRSFCFPCMAKILGEARAKKKNMVL